jgi:hypothetical protein
MWYQQPMRRNTVLVVMLGVATACAHGLDAGGAARQAVVEDNLPDLQECFDELDAPPGLAGSLVFGVELRRNGTVEWVDIELDELGLAKLSACAVRRIKRWRFPEDRRRRTIRFGVGFATTS